MQKCKTFFENQVGALITTPDLFSGMEAANVIWVTDGDDGDLRRSNKLRAIEKLCVIDTSGYNSNLDPTIESGFEVDIEFARCQYQMGGSLFNCQSHLGACHQAIVICHSCAVVCHQSCEVEEHSAKELSSCSYRTLFLSSLGFGVLFPCNPCSCPASGQCH